MALTACSDSDSPTKSAAQPEETPPPGSDDNGGDNNGGDNNGGDNSGDNNGGNNNGGNNNGGNNNGGDNSGGDNSGGDNNGGTNPGQDIDEGCLYAAADYQEPEALPIQEYLDISLQSDTYRIQQGQEMTSADSDLTGTWLLTHNVQKKTSTRYTQKIITDHHRMVFVIRERNGTLEYGQCTGAQIDAKTLAPDFIPMEADSVGDEARLLLNQAASSVKMTIDSNTSMSGITLNGIDDSDPRTRVEYSGQYSKAVKISASTNPFGTLSLSAFELASDHNNVGVYCTVLTHTYASTSQCLTPEISRRSDVFLATRGDGNVRTDFGFSATSGSSSELLIFGYQQDNGSFYKNFIAEKLTGLPNQGSPASSINLAVSKSRISGNAAIQGLVGLKQEIAGSANVTMDIQVPLQIQP
ncbi:hypothetical protein A3759_13425 [Thalassolituus sp. HI0120]|nr:hypothetical protein A3759_13425 [Thalassolituus sp. HI0120]